MSNASPWSPPELTAAAVSADERDWVPGALPGVAMRPLLFDTLRVAWTNVVRLRTEGVISRHAHPAPVHAYVIAGHWHFAERVWRAEPGIFLFEPPGDVHTLIAEGAESLTLFWITGALIELDPRGRAVGYADVFTRIEQASRHFEAVGLGADYVRRFIR